MRLAALGLLVVAAAALAAGPTAPAPAPATSVHHEVIIVDATHGLTTVPIGSPSDFLGVARSPADGATEVSVLDASGHRETLRLATHQAQAGG